jgi:hypothetical protein
MAAIATALVLIAANPASAQVAEPPTINVTATISAEPASQIPFPIRVGPAASIPRKSFVRVRGMPAMVALSEGYSIGPGSWAIPLGPGSWAIPLRALANLKMTLPATALGRAEILVSLVAVDGSVLVEARSTLIVGPPQPDATNALGARRPPQPVLPQIAAPAILPEDRERALKLMQKGDEQLAQGLVATARLLYERAADLGIAQAAMALAATYDAAELTSPNRRGISPDAKEAKRWYERARQLGASDADQRLRRLSGNKGN